jgi:hypothetical protein
MSYRNAHNLGNEIQMLAAQRFLPQVDFMIESDYWADVLGAQSEPVAMIMNGWFSHRPEGWPPPDNIVPLLISFHITDASYDGWSKLGLNPTAYFIQCANYLRRWGPVGTRDLYTLELLQNQDIPAYFSGCLTLTLEQDPAIEREDFIACVDVPDRVLLTIRQRTKRPLLVLTHEDVFGRAEQRLTRARRLLDNYQRAFCVITSRLHCSMPCLAFETPVLLLDVAPDRYRFSGLDLLVRHCSVDKFMSEPQFFDVNNPLLNEIDYLKFRNDLISRASAFIDRAPALAQQLIAGDDTSLQMRYNTLWARYVDLKREMDGLKSNAPG